VNTVYFDSAMSDGPRRSALYAGALFVFSPRVSTVALSEHMREMIATGHGAPNVDSRCTGTSLPDFMRVSDSAHLPAEIVAMYDDETSAEGVLLYSPAPAS
jgi:hypothetical protein